MNTSTIIGLGLSLPDHVRTNDAWPRSYVEGFENSRNAHKKADFTKIETERNERAFDDLFRKYAGPHENDPFKGTTARRVAPAHTRIVDYEIDAAKRALAHAHLDAREIDVVVASALLPETLCPTPAPAIQDAIGAINAAPVGMEAYCASALAQLDYANGLIASGSANYVLCVQSHIINDRINMMDLPFSPLFGDAASAFVVARAKADRGILGTVRGGDGSLRGAVTLVHREAPDSTWYRNAHGQIVPGMTDPEATKRLARGLLELPIRTLNELSEKYAFPLDSASAVITIQPQTWFMPAIAEGLQLPASKFPDTFERYAHIGTCAITANLIEAERRGLLRDGANIVLYGHGAGLARYATLLRWSAIAS